MILQVLTHTGKIQRYVNAGSNEGILWPNSAVHEDVGTSDGAGGEQNLLANVDGVDGTTLRSGELYTGGGEVAVEKDFRDGETGQDVQILARGQGIDVGGACIGAGPIGRVDS